MLTQRKSIAKWYDKSCSLVRLQSVDGRGRREGPKMLISHWQRKTWCSVQDIIKHGEGGHWQRQDWLAPGRMTQTPNESDPETCVWFSWGCGNTLSWTGWLKDRNIFSHRSESSKSKNQGTSLAVQWLGLCASTAGGTGSIPGQGTKILQASQCGQNKQTNKQNQGVGRDTLPPKALGKNLSCLCQVSGGCWHS